MQANQQPSSGAGAIDGGSTDPRAKGQEMAAQAQEKAQEAANQLQDKLRQQLDQRSSQAAEQISTHASALRTVSGSLREQGKEGPAKAADRLAGYAEKAGGYLEGKNSDALLSDAEDFARRQPWVVAAGGLALGFAASRFVKASGKRRYAERSAGQPSASASQLSDLSGRAMPTTTPPAGPPVPVAGGPATGLYSAAGSEASPDPNPPIGSTPGADPWRS